MAFDKFLIAPSETGLQTSLRPWLIADDAFSLLQNAYVFRGRVKKRFGAALIGGTQLFSRLRIPLTNASGTTDGTGAASGNVTTNDGGTIFAVGQLFSIGTEIFTVQALGTPTVMLTTGASTTHTFDTTTGNYVFAGAAANAQIYFYPALPVMGITIFENGPINNQPTYAFDTQFAYIFTGGQWQRSGTGTSPVWHGTDTNFFWTTTYRAAPGVAALFVSNFYAVNPNGAVDATDDPIWYLTAGVWTALTPTTLTAGDTVLTARVIVQFKNRLVLLNTIEVNSAGNTNTNFVNRCRFSAEGDPTNANAFLEITQNNSLGAGFVDAATAEAIVTAEFIKDRLIVYFERSTWELAFTGNGITPFQWNKINTELGSESTFSSVPFDTEVLAIGSTGVHACNGAQVARIDSKIPDTIFTIKNSAAATNRVGGIRDYFAEMVYWTYPSDNSATQSPYPNKILVYNYQNKSWAQNDDCITAFGYFEQGSGPTWSSTSPQTWAENGSTWNSGYVQAQARQIVAGNQQGFTFIVFPDDVGNNASAMQLTDVSLANTILTLTIVNHTLAENNISIATDPEDSVGVIPSGDYIIIQNAVGSVNINNVVFSVDSVIDANTIAIIAPPGFTLGGTYAGGGTITRISDIKIQSKQWNPYDKEDSNVYLARIDFAVLKTGAGEITVDYYPSATTLSMLQAGTVTNSIMGNNILETRPYDPLLYPLEQVQERLWHPVYFQSVGECIQISMYLSDTQMRSTDISWSDFEMEGLILLTCRSSARLQ